MRTLSGTLLAAQQATSIDALVKIVFTLGEDTYTYTRTRILDIEEREDGSLQFIDIVLDNADGTLTDLDLGGFKGVLSTGAVTGAGEEYSACAPMWVMAQRFNSVPGRLLNTLSLVGICNLMAEDKASEVYKPDEDDNKTVKTLIGEIIGASLTCFSHCKAYVISWDGDDDLIDTYKPKDSFRIYTGNNRLSRINYLLNLTKCVMRAGGDGKLHIFNPTTSGRVYDYEYKLVDGHTFFAKALRNRVVTPNYIKVQSREDDDPQYSGTAQDASYASLPDELKKHEYLETYLESNDQATKIAEAILAKAQMWCEAGSANVPLNVGAEVFDYVKVTDEREEDSRVGNIGQLTRHINLMTNEWRTPFVFGNWQNVRKALAELGISADDLVNYFARLKVGDLYVENILAENVDFVWIDEDGNIDLDKIGDDIDNLADGEYYARTRRLHIDASGVYVQENTLYTLRMPGEEDNNLWKSDTAPTSPETGDFWLDTNSTPNKVMQWDGDSWEELSEEDRLALEKGVIVRRLKAAALTANGLVVLDEVQVGTYDLVLATDIQAGHILLSKTTKDGEWYNESGVEIDATHGINLYGTNNALTTRATKTGTIQCYVGSDGKLYAGTGKVLLDIYGLAINGLYFQLNDTDGNGRGQMYGGADAVNIAALAGHYVRLSSGTGVLIEGKMRIPVGVDLFN